MPQLPTTRSRETRALEVETKRLQNLHGALASRLVIGRAEGILMNREQLITGDQAFDLLSRASQQLNIKLREIAQYVAGTGDIPSLPGDPRQSSDRGGFAVTHPQRVCLSIGGHRLAQPGPRERSCGARPGAPDQPWHRAD